MVTYMNSDSSEKLNDFSSDLSTQPTAKKNSLVYGTELHAFKAKTNWKELRNCMFLMTDQRSVKCENTKSDLS